jgi:hypothetical protein
MLTGPCIFNRSKKFFFFFFFFKSQWTGPWAIQTWKQIQKRDRKMSPENRTEARNLLIPSGREPFALDPVVSRSTTLRHRRRIENHHRKKPISDDAPHRRLTKPATNLPENSTLRLTGSTTIDPDQAIN